MVGVDPRTFGDGRAADAAKTRIEADALYEIFNPAGFTKEWTGDEIGRVADALVGLSLPFDLHSTSHSEQLLCRNDMCGSNQV